MANELSKIDGETSEFGAGDVYNAPVSAIWYETDKSAIDYDPRVERDLSAEFVAGIETDGVLESITVRRRTNPANPKQTLKVVNGKTRFRGAKKAGRVVIKVGIVECDDKEALRLQVMLNAHRFADESDLQCDNAARLRAAGYDVPAIAATFGIPVSTVANTLKIVDRVPEVAANPNIGFAAKEELARRDPDVAKAALEAVNDLADAAKASPDGKAKGITGGRKADATTKKTKTGETKAQVSHSAVKAIADAIEGKPAKPEKDDKPAKSAPAPKAAPTVAAKDTRPDAGSLRAKAATARAVSMLAKGTGTSAEVHRAFVAGVQAALFFAAGDKVEGIKIGCLTPDAQSAVSDVLARLFGKDAAEKDAPVAKTA
jgi:ParB-like chromosome segregation protein Spo0J